MIDYSPDEHPLKDDDVLAALTNEVGETVLSSLLSLFCDESEKLLMQLRSALEARDLQEIDAQKITRFLHSIKSGAKTYGAARLAALSEALEDQAREGDIASVFENMGQLNALLNETMTLFKAD